MVVHRGAVVAQWGDTAAKTQLASVRKSLLNALIGNAVERGQIDLSQPIGELGIDDNEPSLSAEEKSATVRDLLQARSGIYHVALHEAPEAVAQRPPRFSHKPGTFWYYKKFNVRNRTDIQAGAIDLIVLISPSPASRWACPPTRASGRRLLRRTHRASRYDLLRCYESPDDLDFRL
jgi:Beta-lactamase